MAQHISSDAEMAMVLKAKYVVADFFAQWCGPCKMISPHVEQRAMENKHVKTVKVDVDVAKDVASYYRVTSMPTFILFENGMEIDRFSGADRNRIDDMFRRCKEFDPFSGVGHRIGGARSVNSVIPTPRQEQNKKILITVGICALIVVGLFVINSFLGNSENAKTQP